MVQSNTGHALSQDTLAPVRKQSRRHIYRVDSSGAADRRIQLEIWGLFLTQPSQCISKSRFSSIRDLRRIRNALDFTTAHTIATSLTHSKLDCCNSLFLNLPQSQLSRLQLILNSTARAVSNTPTFSDITPVLKSHHWLKIEQRIQYKAISIT